MYTVKEMTEESAKTISKWKYESPYEMYSFLDNEEEVDELLNGLHFAVYNYDLKGEFSKEPCGFLAIGWSAQIQDLNICELYEDESYTDIAFGMHPKLCGKGSGKSFVNELIAFVRDIFEEDGIRLTVAMENIRACSLYEKMGFKEIARFATKSIETAKGREIEMKVMIL